MRLIPRVPRRVAVPAGIAGALQLTTLSAGNRLLAWSLLIGGGAAAATVHDLRIITPRGRTMIRPWAEVDHAVWEQDSRMLVVWWVDSRRTTPLEIQDDVGRLPEVIRERVQASIVLAAEVPLPGGRAGRVALRRRPDGGLSAQSLLPPGVKEADPAVASVLATAIEALWAEAGDIGLNRGGLPPL